MTIKELSIKLRRTADMLDELIGNFKFNETPITALKIKKELTKKRKYVRKGLHWTQKPENKIKLIRHLRKTILNEKRQK